MSALHDPLVSRILTVKHIRIAMSPFQLMGNFHSGRGKARDWNL